MKLKTMLKHQNRGLMLALVILIGLMIYLIVDDETFEKNSPALEQLINDYYSEVLELNIIPQEYVDEDSGLITDDGLIYLESEYQEIIERYWTDKISNNYYNYAVSKDALMEEYFKSCISEYEKMPNPSPFTDIIYNLKNVTIEKGGPNIAYIDCEYEITAEFNAVYLDEDVLSEELANEYKNGVSYSNAFFISPEYAENMAYYMYDLNIESETEDYLVKYSLQGSDRFKATLVDGKWKIYGIGNNMKSSGFDLVSQGGNA